MDYEAFEPDESVQSVEYIEDGVEIEHLRVDRGDEEIVEYAGDIYGTPDIDAEVWERVEESNYSAVACETFVAKQLLGDELTDAAVREAAESWYTPERGIAIPDIGNALECVGIETERERGLTVKYISEMLDNNEKVICAVNAAELYHPTYGMPQYIRPDHAVEVIGVDATDPSNIKLILNDPSAERGGTVHSMKSFISAWRSSGFYAVSASLPKRG